MPQPDPAVTRSRTAGLAVVDHLSALAHCRVTLLCEASAAWASSWSTHLSPVTRVCAFEGSAVRLTRRVADLDGRLDTGLTFLVPGADGGTLWQGGRLRRLARDEVVVVDDASPFDHRMPAHRGAVGRLAVVHVERSGLDVAPVEVRTAASRLRESPLHDLVRDHLRGLADLPEPVGRPVADDLDRAVRLLLAALLASCGAQPTGAPA